MHFQQEQKLQATQWLICFIQKWFEWEPKAKEQQRHQFKKQQARKLLLKPESDQCYQKVATLSKLYIMKNMILQTQYIDVSEFDDEEDEDL